MQKEIRLEGEVTDRLREIGRVLGQDGSDAFINDIEHICLAEMYMTEKMRKDGISEQEINDLRNRRYTERINSLYNALQKQNGAYVKVGYETMSQEEVWMAATDAVFSNAPIEYSLETVCTSPSAYEVN